MLNELYELSVAMKRAGISAPIWHRKYTPIPKVTNKAPCIRIVLGQGHVLSISSVTEEQAKTLRKYGSNQGSFPCMNLAPLYRVSDPQIKRQIAKLKAEDLSEDKIAEIRGWCVENNWCEKFQSKYKISFVNTPTELERLSVSYRPLQLLIEDVKPFNNSQLLHCELEKLAFEMLQNREQVSTALAMLFYAGKEGKEGREDYGSLSVALDSQMSIEEGTSATSMAFVEGMNQALLDVDGNEEVTDAQITDAFAVPFEPLDEPMPKVKLSGGFDVSLRTMFKGQPCQTRYGRIENDTYPISLQMRKDLQSALDWIGNEEHKDVTWVKTADNKEELLFAYPSDLPKSSVSFTRMFRQPNGQSKSFEEQAAIFIKEIRQGRDPSKDTHATRIQVFVLRKIDRARTKVVYTCLTDPSELEHLCEEWTIGSLYNLPDFSFGKPNTIFPMNVADVLNLFWKQNGDAATEHFKPTPQYHGVELLLDRDASTVADLHMLSDKVMTIAPLYGYRMVLDEMQPIAIKQLKDLLSLLSLILYRNNIRKDEYMERLPYLYGQLLKAADELHALYCAEVRNNSYPPQFVGGSMFQSAAEAPVRTLNLLGQRMAPYYTWAKSYRLKGEKDSSKAGWLYARCETITQKLYENWTPTTRFTDEEKALLFIGYLAKAQSNKKEVDGTKEESSNE